MAKNNRFGQAEILTDDDLKKIYRQLKSNSHKLFFDIAQFTGERWGAICQLKVSDVYHDKIGMNILEPLKEITFRAQTRKASPNGERKTRQVLVCDRLGERLSWYSGCCLTSKVWLFCGRDENKPITFSGVDSWLRLAVEAAGLEHRGISTHSFRRTFINKLYHEGAMDIYAIQQLIGHSSILTTQKYLSADKKDLAIALNNVFS